jgi:hypothetical protein
MTEDDAEGPNDTSPEIKEPDEITLAQFLEEVPPSQKRAVSRITDDKEVLRQGGQGMRALHTPELQLHCTSNTCNGLRFFRFQGSQILIGSARANIFITLRLLELS